MDAKILIALLLVVNCYCSCGAALRRTPKVYNALITTDENLTSSRAYPVIQPSIHETGIATYPFGPYNPYGIGFSNSLVRFGQPLVPGLAPRDQRPYPFPPQPYQQRFPQQQPLLPQQFQPQEPQLPPSGPPALPPTGPQQALPPSGPAQEPQSQNEVIPPPSAPAQEPIPIQMQDQMPPQMQPSEKLPIPLNEFGLPPSLIPLQPYPQRHRQPLPINLPPYPYQNFPVLYEPYSTFQEHYLPPYEYFPSHTYGIAAAPPRVPTPPPAPQQQPPQPQSPPATPEAPQPPQDQQPEPTSPAPVIAEHVPEVPLESIKNASPNKNKEVPDVPPPPIPSGGKSTKRSA